eukprot:5906250-Pyramimonas_sp.AAC.1
MLVATLAEDHAKVTRLATVDPAWAPWMPSLPNSAGIPASMLQRGLLRRCPRSSTVRRGASLVSACRWKVLLIHDE